MLNVIILSFIILCVAKLSVTMLNIVILDVIVLSAIMLNFVMLNVMVLKTIKQHAECHYAECRNAECHYAGCLYSEGRGTRETYRATVFYEVIRFYWGHAAVTFFANNSIFLFVYFFSFVHLFHKISSICNFLLLVLV